MEVITYVKEILYKGGFVRNVVTLMTGTAIAQAIPILISPILTRLYTPNEFGILALYMAVVSVVAIIVTGRYELAVMLPESDEDAINVGALALSVALAISLLTLLIVGIFNKPIAQLLGKPEIANWLYLVPFSVLFIGIYQILNYWSTRRKQYGQLALSRVSQSVANGSVNLGVGFSGLGITGLLSGVLFGQGVAAFILGWQVRKDLSQYKKSISKQRMLRNAKKYQDFPKVNSLHALVDVLQSSGVVFLISALFGGSILGLYAFTLRILNAPLGLLGASVSQVFYQKASETYKNGGDLQPLVRKTILSLGMMALPIFLVIGFLAPILFEVIFGKDWSVAGTYAQILAPWLFLNFIVSPISQVPIIVGKQKKSFIIALIGNSIILLSIIYSGYYAHNIKVGFYLISCLETIYLICIMVWLHSISKKKVCG